MSITLNTTPDEILLLCNRAARWVAHDEQSAEAAANGAAAHIIQNADRFLDVERIEAHKAEGRRWSLYVLCKSYVRESYKREHHRRDGRVSMHESEFSVRSEDEHGDGDLLSFFAILRDGVESHSEVERQVEFREMKAELETLINSLAHQQRTVMRLYFAGNSTQEIAELLDVPAALVRKRATAARKHLRGQNPDLGKYQEFLLSYRPSCKRENYFKRARQGETDRYIRQGKRTYAGYYGTPTLL
jgi:RNA polymerase sigma factor (sigma-70 family)